MILLGLCSQRGCSGGLELPRSWGKCRRMTGAHGFGRRRQRSLFLVFGLVIVGAPIVAIIVLRFEVRPFPRLLAVHIDFVLAAARCCGVWGPAGTTSWLVARVEQQVQVAGSGILTCPYSWERHSRMNHPWRRFATSESDATFVLGASWFRSWTFAGNDMDGGRRAHVTGEEAPWKQECRFGSAHVDGRQKAAGVLGWLARGVQCGGGQSDVCAVDDPVCGNPRSSRIEMSVRSRFSQDTVSSSGEDKPNQTRLRKGMEKPAGLSSRCSPQNSRPGHSGPRPQGSSVRFSRDAPVEPTDRFGSRAGVEAWRDAKMTICNQKKTLRSRRHKALNWVFCRGRTRDAAAETPVCRRWKCRRHWQCGHPWTGYARDACTAFSEGTQQLDSLEASLQRPSPAPPKHPKAQAPAPAHQLTLQSRPDP